MTADNLQIPKVQKLGNKIKNLVTVSPRQFQFQGLQRPQKCPETLSHLGNKRRDIQPTSLEVPEVPEGAKVLGVDFRSCAKSGL